MDDNALQVIPKQSFDYHYYLSGQIATPDKYLDLLKALTNASGNDRFYIHINSLGGSSATAIQIISALKKSKAKIHTIIEGNAFSAAAMIFMAGECLSVSPHSSMMVHGWSVSTTGKSQEIWEMMCHNKKNLSKFLADIYGDFLTDKEYDDISKGMDLYFDSVDTISRLKSIGRNILED